MFLISNKAFSTVDIKRTPKTQSLHIANRWQ